MAVTTDIVATYRGPAAVIRKQLAQGPREDRALVYVMAGCLIVFVAQLPRLSREAHLTGQDFQMLMGGTLLAWIFIMPLVLYVLAFVARLLGRVLGGHGTGYGARLALFWAVLASSPLILLHGLVAGFIGNGPALTSVGVVWLSVFCWFWIGGSLAQERART